MLETVISHILKLSIFIKEYTCDKMSCTMKQTSMFETKRLFGIKVKRNAVVFLF